MAVLSPYANNSLSVSELQKDTARQHGARANVRNGAYEDIYFFDENATDGIRPLNIPSNFPGRWIKSYSINDVVTGLSQKAGGRTVSSTDIGSNFNNVWQLGPGNFRIIGTISNTPVGFESVSIWHVVQTGINDFDYVEATPQNGENKFYRVRVNSNWVATNVNADSVGWVPTTVGAIPTLTKSQITSAISAASMPIDTPIIVSDLIFNGTPVRIYTGKGGEVLPHAHCKTGNLTITDADKQWLTNTLSSSGYSTFYGGNIEFGASKGTKYNNADYSHDGTQIMREDGTGMLYTQTS